MRVENYKVLRAIARPLLVVRGGRCVSKEKRKMIGELEGGSVNHGYIFVCYLCYTEKAIPSRTQEGAEIIARGSYAWDKNNCGWYCPKHKHITESKENNTCH